MVQMYIAGDIYVYTLYICIYVCMYICKMVPWKLYSCGSNDNISFWFTWDEQGAKVGFPGHYTVSIGFVHHVILYVIARGNMVNLK